MCLFLFVHCYSQISVCAFYTQEVPHRYATTAFNKQNEREKTHSQTYKQLLDM